jgi:choline dehydrogenase-like flavoprotein
MARLGSEGLDAVVVGSGPGGTTVARQLARGGKRVLLLERGRDHRKRWHYGGYVGALRTTDRASLLFTRQGLNVIRPLLLGGATNMFCACAHRPPTWLAERYGLELDRDVDETIEELGIAPLAAELRGAASTRLAEAADALGLRWEPEPKFLRPGRAGAGAARSGADAFRDGCGARCMLGCRCGAKWTASEYADEAAAAGCEVVTGARVDRALVEDGHAVGVAGTRSGGAPFEARAPIVVVAAGGIGTPLILQASGLERAGQGLAMDATVMVYGASRERGNAHDPPMTYGWTDDEQGYMLAPLIDPWLLYPLILGMEHVGRSLTWHRWGRTLGIMVKVKDDVSGSVTAAGGIDKPLTERDRSRLAHGIELCRKILVQAGCDPSSIFPTPLRGTHPSATVRVGDVLTTDLETPVEGLYVCDASVFPEALDRPTVLTIIALGKRLARHLLSGS